MEVPLGHPTIPKEERLVRRYFEVDVTFLRYLSVASYLIPYCPL